MKLKQFKTMTVIEDTVPQSNTITVNNSSSPNMAIGAYAGVINSTGSCNTALGFSAMCGTAVLPDYIEVMIDFYK